MQSLIIAGGQGTRMRDVLGSTPKSLAPIGAKPFLHLQLHWLQEAERLHFCLGHRWEEIVEALNGCRMPHGEAYSWSVEPEPLGVIGSIGHALPHLEEEFAVLLGDVLPRPRFAELVKRAVPQLEQGRSVMFLTAASDRPGQKGNVDLAGELVGTYCKEESYRGRYVDIGFWLLRREHVDLYGTRDEETFFRTLANEKLLSGIDAGAPSFEVGSREGLAELLAARKEADVHVDCNRA